LPVRLAAAAAHNSYALLRTVSRLSQAELQAALARLVASELVFQRGTPPDAVYSFKHVLVQDAAHASLLRSTRQQLHAQLYQVELPGPKLPVTAPVESRRTWPIPCRC
jgi:predicted ATPase